MQTHRISALHQPITVWLGLAGGGLVFIGGVVLALTGDALWQAGRLMLTGIGLYAAVVARSRSGVEEIRTHDDGMIALVALNHTTVIAARAIWRLIGEYVSSRRPSHLLIQHAKGRYRFDKYERVMVFVAWVEAHNPEVEIGGLWLMGPP
jgi:hypothetical protein